MHSDPMLGLDLIAVSYMGVEELGVFVGEVVLEPGEELGPGGAGAGHRPPVGTRSFNPSNQLRMTASRAPGAVAPVSPPPTGTVTRNLDPLASRTG